jgi:hypothetical protein
MKVGGVRMMEMYAKLSRISELIIKTDRLIHAAVRADILDRKNGPF